MNMFQNCGLGILAQYSENLVFKTSNFVPNLARNRYFGGHDDGFHFSNCKGQITIDSCRFLALMDDPINVHGTSVKIVKILGDKKTYSNRNIVNCYEPRLAFVYFQDTINKD